MATPKQTAANRTNAQKSGPPNQSAPHTKPSVDEGAPPRSEAVKDLVISRQDANNPGTTKNFFFAPLASWRETVFFHVSCQINGHPCCRVQTLRDIRSTSTESVSSIPAPLRRAAFSRPCD